MVFYKLADAIGYNPVYPFVLLFSRERWFFVTSRKDRMWSTAIALFSILVASYLFLALLRIVHLTIREFAVVSVSVFLLHMSRLVLRARQAVWADRSEIIPAGVHHRIYLCEWVGFCLSMAISLYLVAETIAKPVFSVLAAVFLCLLGVPLAQISVYRLQESVSRRRRRIFRSH